MCEPTETCSLPSIVDASDFHVLHWYVFVLCCGITRLRALGRQLSLFFLDVFTPMKFVLASLCCSQAENICVRCRQRHVCCCCDCQTRWTTQIPRALVTGSHLKVESFKHQDLDSDRQMLFFAIVKGGTTPAGVTDCRQSEGWMNYSFTRGQTWHVYRL